MSYAIEAVARQAADEVLLDVDDDELDDEPEPDEELDDEPDDDEDVSEEEDEDEDEEPSLFAAADLDEPPLVLLDEEPRLSFR
jgi:hypothetical protein